MQKPLFLLILSLHLFSAAVCAAEDPLRPIRRQFDEVYRLSQEMVEHGSHGHPKEIVRYGKELIERAEKLTDEIEIDASPELKDIKEKILSSLEETIFKTREAVRWGEQKAKGPALEAARKASAGEA